MSKNIAVAENPNYAEEAQEMAKNPTLRAMVVDLIEALGHDTARTILVDRGEGLEDSEFFDSFHTFQMQARATAHENGVKGSYIGAVCRAMKLIIEESDTTDFPAEGIKLAQRAKGILESLSPYEFARIGILESGEGDEVTHFIAKNAARATTMQTVTRFSVVIGAVLGVEGGVADPMAVRWTIKFELDRVREITG